MLLKWHKHTGRALRATCNAVGHTTHVCVTTGQGAQMLLGLLVSLEVFVLVGWESLVKFRIAFTFDPLLSRMTTLAGN